MLERPDPLEHESYYGLYIGRVPDGDVLEILEAQVGVTLDLLASVPPELEQHRYAAGKWSVREVVGHVIDVERVFTHRAFTIARGDPEPLAGMDQDVYAAESRAHARPLADLARELAAVRAATLALFRGFSDDVWTRTGVASGFSFTVRTFPYIIAGHELHHRVGLESHYLGAASDPLSDAGAEAG